MKLGLWWLTVCILSPCLVTCSLIIEEKIQEESFPKTSSETSNSGYSTRQSEQILEILSAQHGHSMSEDFPAFVEDFTRCLSQGQRKRNKIIDVKNPAPSETPIMQEKPGWSNSGPPPARRCIRLGLQCEDGISREEGWSASSGGWGWPSSGWGSGWSSNPRCCNNDLCRDGRCCTPTPATRSHSICQKDSDCCDGGKCSDAGVCQLKLGKICTQTSDCEQGECTMGRCCIPTGCIGTATKCSANSDCCGSGVCSSGNCLSGSGQSCQCDGQCASGFECSGNGGTTCAPVVSVKSFKAPILE